MKKHNASPQKERRISPSNLDQMPHKKLIAKYILSPLKKMNH